MFSKNGTDATTTCVTLARAGTGRRKILVAQGAYHGAVPWCTPSSARRHGRGPGPPAPLSTTTIASLEDAPSSRPATTWPRSSSSAFRHDYGRDQELPTPLSPAGSRELCDATRRGAHPRRRPRRLPHDLARQLGAARRPARSQRLEQGDRQRPRAGRGDRQRPLPRGRARRSSSPARSGAARSPWRQRVATLDVLRTRSTARRTCGRWASGCATGMAAQAAAARPRRAPDRPGADADDPVRRRPGFQQGRALHARGAKRGVYLHPGTTCSCRRRTPRPTSTSRSRRRRPPSAWSPGSDGTHLPLVTAGSAHQLRSSIGRPLSAARAFTVPSSTQPWSSPR